MPDISSLSLSFDEVSMTFPDGTEALRDVSISVNSSEFVSVVGPSGCGKSTILNIASGLLEPTSGSVKITDTSMGYIFQDPTLLPWRTVFRNVELLCELHQVPKEERRKRAHEVINLVGLTGFENHFPKALSGGMKMRASLARTLTLHPRLFLFDEPFGSLDEITREKLNDETQILFQKEGFSSLFITHSISEAVYLSTKVYVMSERPGRIIAEFDIPFNYPRVPQQRFDPNFAEICGEISNTLRGLDHD